MKTLTCSATALTILTATPLFAGDQYLEKCIAEIKKQKTGEMIKLEKLNIAGQPIYEFEIEDPQGSEWEFICDASTGRIIETEAEVESADNEAFKRKMKVSEQEATAIALKAFPGTIVELEYEIEDNGNASYEIDIVNQQGIETKVEVDAATGKIIESALEEWEIGEEVDEKR